MVDAGSLMNTQALSQGLGSGITGIKYFGVIIVFVALIGALIFFIMWFKSYNILCIIEEKLEYGNFITIRKGKVKGDKKHDGNNPVDRIWLMGVKKPIMHPCQVKVEEVEARYDIDENGIPKKDEKGNPLIFHVKVVKEINYKSLWGIGKKGKKMLHIMKHGDEYTVVPWTKEELENYLATSKPVRKQWGNNMVREAWELHPPKQSFFEKWGSMIMMGGAFILITIIFIFMFNKFDVLKATADTLDQSNANLAKSMDKMAESNMRLALALEQSDKNGGIVEGAPQRVS